MFGLAVFGAVKCRLAAGTIGKGNIRFAADRTFGSRSHFDSIVSADRGGRRLAGGIQCVIKHSISNYLVCNLLAVRLLRWGPCPLPCINNRYFRLVPSGFTVHIELDCKSGYKPSAVQNYVYGKVHVVDRSSHFSEKSRFQVPLPDRSTACQGHDRVPRAGREPRAAPLADTPSGSVQHRQRVTEVRLYST